MKHYNIPIFINHFGCPNDCVFCNQKKINGCETDITSSDIKKIIEMHLETLPKNSKKEVAFFGGTFTGISMELQKEYLEVVYEYIKSGDIYGIRLSTRPDYIDEEKVKMLKKYGVVAIELGVQSLDEKVLFKTGRYYSIKEVINASSIIKNYGIELGIQLMIGLPEANEESDYNTALKVLEIKPDTIRIYPTLVIKNTELARNFKTGSYIPLTLEEAITRTKKIYSLFEYNDINIIRVGLQPTEELNDSENVLGGPFHPAFRELVINEIYFDFFRRNFKENEKIEVSCNQKNVSKIIGMKKINKIKLKNNLDVTVDNNLTINEILINKKIYLWKEILGEKFNEPNNSECQ